VHRAELLDGRQVVVKIQYPEVMANQAEPYLALTLTLTLTLALTLTLTLTRSRPTSQVTSRRCAMRRAAST